MTGQDEADRPDEPMTWRCPICGIGGSGADRELALAVHQVIFRHGEEEAPPAG